MMAMATGMASWVVDAIRDPGTQTYGAREEHGPKRLDQRLLDAIADVAWGVEAGEAGLKSCSAENQTAEGAGHASDHGWHQDRGGRAPNEYRDVVQSVHGRDVQDVWDDYLNELESLLYQGYGCTEALRHLRTKGWDAALGSVHMLALERWISKVGLHCNPDRDPPQWRGSRLHEDRRRAARAFADLQRAPNGATHTAVLHIVYGPHDPFVLTLGSEAVRMLGKDLAPIARYTEAVETHRQKLVKEEARRRSDTSPPASARDRHGPGWLSGALAHMGETQEVSRLAVVHNVRREIEGERRDEVVARVYDLERHRTAQAWANRVISSGDAIRAALQPFTEPLPEQGPAESRVELERRREARSERKRLHNAGIDAFLLAVKIDANRMLTEASRAFEASWERA